MQLIPVRMTRKKIRNCIIDYYTNWGIMSVILGGDADPNNSSNLIVPHRGFWGSVDNDYDVPADMYYSCLDGTWNDDNDNKWGEPNEDDLFEEVSIGRLCVDSQTEVNNMTNKLIMYQDEPVVADIEKNPYDRGSTRQLYMGRRFKKMKWLTEALLTDLQLPVFLQISLWQDYMKEMHTGANMMYSMSSIPRV